MKKIEPKKVKSPFIVLCPQTPCCQKQQIGPLGANLIISEVN